jgi:hypothetical protein
MTHRCDLLIERYGTIVPIDSTKADKLRNASMNLKLRICDGLPVSCGIDKLLIGSIGSAYNDLKLLQSYGVTHIVNCSTKIHNKYEENLKYFRFSIEDGSVNLFQEFKGNTVWDSITEATDMEGANITECLDFILNAIHIDNGTVLGKNQNYISLKYNNFLNNFFSSSLLSRSFEVCNCHNRILNEISSNVI